MAQKGKPGITVRARRALRRYGVTPARAVAAALCVLVVAAACIGVFCAGVPKGVEVERAAAQDAAGTEETTGVETEPVLLVVHVDGAVAAPGVYELAEGSRVNDAVLAAGGLVEGADTSSINLASPLVDGGKVHVPSAKELAATTTGGGSGSSSSLGSSSTGSTSSGLVNINLATAEELQTLSGVGEATAAAIIEDREANGPFTSPEDLMRVSGIGEKKYSKVKDHICV